MSDKKVEDFSLFKPEVFARKTGLAYIPLYSPAVRRSKQTITSTPSRTEDDMELLDSSHFGCTMLERSFSDSEIQYESDFREGHYLPRVHQLSIIFFLLSVVSRLHNAYKDT